jgi:hypothetical protein
VLRDADVPLDIVPGGGHQATVWRAALTPMFDWMTPQLAQEVQRLTIERAHFRAIAMHRHKEAEAAKAAKAAKTAKPKSPVA